MTYLKQFRSLFMGSFITLVIVGSLLGYLAYTEKIAWVKSARATLQIEDSFRKVRCDGIRYLTWNSETLVVVGNGGLTKYGYGGLVRTSAGLSPNNRMTWGMDNEGNGSGLREDKEYLVAEICRGAIYEDLGIFEEYRMPLSATSRSHWYVPGWSRIR